MLGKGIIVSVVRLGLPADLDHARWREIGTTLSHLERAVAWWVGDWWAFGEHRYGALREISEDPGWPGPAYQTCANAAAVSGLVSSGWSGTADGGATPGTGGGT